MKRENLSDISVFNTGLYNINDYSPFTEFCVNRKLRNLDQLFKYIDKKGIDTDCLFVKKEIRYLINLLKYKYLLISFKQFNNLDLIIDIDNKNSSPIKYEMKYGVRISELGFNQEEVKYISSVIKNFNSKRCTIGELFMYIEEKNALTNELNNKSLINKISLLNEYYRKKLSIENNRDNNVVKNNVLLFQKSNIHFKENSDFYEKMDSISIDNCNLISKKIGLITRYFEKFKLNNLGELLRKFDNHEIIYYNISAKIEIEGLVNLIKMKYIKDSLIYKDVLFKYVYLNNNGILDRKQLKIELKKIGFNINESDYIFEYILKRNKSMLIIDGLIGCRNFINLENIDIDLNVLYTKIDLIMEYYFKLINDYKDKKLVLEKTGVL